MNTQEAKSNPVGEVGLSVSGMTCDGCARVIQRVLLKINGVSRATVDFATRRAVVDGTARPEELIAAIEAAGYGASIMPGDAARSERGHEHGCC